MPRKSRRPIVAGEVFGRLIVTGTWTEPTKWGSKRVIQCSCACGKAGVRRDPGALLSGRSTSCGCAAVEALKERSRAPGWMAAARATRLKHGMADSPEHNAWNNMKQRCGNPKTRNFHRYGGRGIKVCDRWRDSFEAFLADMGRRPSAQHSIDRIDNDRGYEPGNCRWATAREQRGNTSMPAVSVRLNGAALSLSDAAAHLGLRPSSVTARFRDMGVWALYGARRCTRDMEARP